MALGLIISVVTTLVVFCLFPFLVLLAVAIYVKVTLEPVRRVCTSKVRLDGKVALVTGGNKGIGLETARDLACRGARVIIACRDADRAAQAIADIAATTGNTQVEYKPLDLSKFKSVRQFAEDFNNTYDRLDILVVNAGCNSYPKNTEDGIEWTMQVNYLSHFLLTNLLLDKLIASKPSRIVIVSSCLHYCARLRVHDLHASSFPGALGQLVNYGNSKLCDILWTKALAKRLPEEVTVNALHPGVIKTDIFETLPSVFRPLFHLIADALLYRSAEEGAQTTIHLCVSEDVKNVKGKYFMECMVGTYSSVADNDKLVEQVYNKSLELTSSSF